MQKISVITLGCPKNTVEAEYLLGQLQNNKFEISSNLESTDIIIIHTCSFINDARLESEECIAKALEIKKKNNTKVYVSGCLPQLLKDKFATAFPDVDGFVGTSDLQKLPKLLKRKEKIVSSFIAGGFNDSKFRVLSSALPSTYLKIAEGCSHKCSFCIIPDLRGKYESRTINSLVSEAESLTDSGIKELIIIAQDTTSYGIDRYNKFALDKLLLKLSQIGKLKWIRLMYAYPTSITDSLLEVINEYKNICSYIDIPIQHSSKKVLSLMKRPLNTVKVIEKIKNKYPDIVLRTSLITGFPGETNTDFKELVNFIKQGYFQYAGVFEYSDQISASSHKLPNHLQKNIACERRIELEKVQYEVFNNIADNLLDKETEILVEGFNKNIAIGRTEFQAPDIDGNIIINSKKHLKFGNFYKGKIKNHKGYDFIAEIK